MSEQSPYSAQYQPPVQPPCPPSMYQDVSPTVTKTEWFIYLILQMIPFVNLVMLIVYAMDNTKPSRANLAKVNLIFLIVGIALGILAFVVFFLCLGAFAGGMGSELEAVLTPFRTGVIS
ncbi:MAG: hypothetical protein J6T06_16065 [Victivallales bacterium]|nr:hypothetical protein [Victivallales bacterium]